MLRTFKGFPFFFFFQISLRILFFLIVLKFYLIVSYFTSRYLGEQELLYVPCLPCFQSLVSIFIDKTFI